MRTCLFGGAMSTRLALVFLCATTATSASELGCRKTLSNEGELLAIHQIENLMGRFVHLSFLGGDSQVESLFAMKTEGVSWKDPVGPTDIKGMRARFDHAAPDQIRAAELNLNTLLTPVIEVARDGKTAQAVWDSVGANVRNLDDVGVWLWTKYGVDFVKQDGEWRIWHLQVYPIFLTPYDKSITQSAKERSIRGDRIPDPPQDWSGPKGGIWMYDGKSLPRGPKVPTPYCTFDANNSN